MHRIVFILIFLATQKLLLAQVVSSEIVPRQKVNEIFTDSLKKKLDIEFPIWKAYDCRDNSGKYFIVFTESLDSIDGKDSLHYKIKAFNFIQEPTGLKKLWELNDFTVEQNNGFGMERSIWFWTKYCEFIDIDSDGLIDPVIIFGTGGYNFPDDGRIKILIFYKGKKIAIRNQSGDLDFQRHLQVDEAFYLLSAQIQNHVKQLMQRMQDDNNAGFTNGWQEAMKKKKTYLDER